MRRERVRARGSESKKESYQTAATKYNVSSNNPKQKMKASNNPENLLKFLLNKLRYFDVNWTTNAMVFYIVAAKCTTLNLPKTGFSDEKSHRFVLFQLLRKLGHFSFWLTTNMLPYLSEAPVFNSGLHCIPADRRRNDVYELNINRSVCNFNCEVSKFPNWFPEFSRVWADSNPPNLLTAYTMAYDDEAA